MTSRMKSFLGGAAVAALLIVPAAADTNWLTLPQKSFGGNSVKVEDLVGSLIVNVKDSGPITVDVSGAKERVNALEISNHDNRVVIEGSNEGQQVWDWHSWLDFSTHEHARPSNLTVKITVPKGTDLNVEDLVGDATIGDTQGPLHFEAAATKAKIGKVSKASVSMEGAGRVDIAEVAGPLDLDIAGSGKVTVGRTAKVHADIAGAGDAALGAVAGGLDLDIAGSGDVSAESVNGPVSVDIAGSGSVKIATGTANPLHVDIMGSGNFTFGGEAVDPHISALGSGSVKLKSYRGKLSSDGMANVRIGE
jgi:hypothetical protein